MFSRIINQHLFRTLSLAIVVVGAAYADSFSVNVVFDNPNQTGMPGQTLQFFGTIYNTGTAEVFLNSDDPNLTSPNAGDFTLTDQFFANVPVSIPLNGNSGDIELFDYTVGSPFPDPFAAYSGEYTLTGGIDGNAADILNNPAATFSITVKSATTVTPEPATFGIAAILLVALAWCARRKMRA